MTLTELIEQAPGTIAALGALISGVTVFLTWLVKHRYDSWKNRGAKMDVLNQYERRVQSLYEDVLKYTVDANQAKQGQLKAEQALLEHRATIEQCWTERERLIKILEAHGIPHNS